MAVQHAIQNGPSKFDFIVSFASPKSADPADTAQAVKFSTRNGSWVAKIYALADEDGSGERWFMNGTVMCDDGSCIVTGRFDGYYRTDNKSGWIQFKD